MFFGYLARTVNAYIRTKHLPPTHDAISCVLAHSSVYHMLYRVCVYNDIHACL